MINKLRRLINGDDKLKLAAGQIFVGNGDGDASAVALTGVGTIDSAGSIAIGTAKITGTMIGASAVNAAKLQYTAVSITLVASAASTTSCHAEAAITAGAKLLGIWLATNVSDVGSFVWAATQGTNSIRIDINEGSAQNTLVFNGVVIEP
jgi:hypothetical protein